MHVSTIETPAIVVDLDVMERNLDRVASYAKEHNLRLRPHTKTHKSSVIGQIQLEKGAVGLTVAKVGEAEVMLRAEPKDLLVAYPVIGRGKLRRLLEVARRTQLTVALDSLEAATGLSEAAASAGLEIGVLVEEDVGLGRVGVPSAANLVDLASAIARLPGLCVKGFNFYPGHVKALDAEGLAKFRALGPMLDETISLWRAAGLPLDVVSGGSTPTLFHSHELPGLNEIRPGTYVFNDRNTIECGAVTVEDCAAHVAVTVVSTNRAEGLIVDGGSKTFSSDRLVTGGEVTFGMVREAPEARFLKMNEEHGYIDLPGARDRFQIGDRLHILPNHICVAVNLHERVYGVRGERVEMVWEVEARGKLQ
ncbi:MAG: alanine racemase [Bryobacterales bacterium]|nr:alanine racemase [Bryobacterales bacterium]